MVFWIGALVIALVIAAWTAMKLVRRTANPAWPAAAGFALSILTALGAATQATVASLQVPAPRPAAATAPQGHGNQAAGGANDNFDSLVTRLEEGLQNDPSDPERWALLGRSYVALGRLDDAVKAFEQAIERSNPADAGLIGEYGETLVAAADGKVAGKAEEAFAQVLTLNPSDPRARYYLALAQAEKGDVDSAIQGLTAMLHGAPADAPWRGTVSAKLEELSPSPQPPPTAAATSENPAPPGPTQEQIQAAQNMTPEERAEMIRGMVDGLAAKMAENPDDYQGWLRLANAYMVLDEKSKAAEALASAVKLQPANAGLLIQYAEVKIAADGGVIGPDAEKALQRADAREPGNPQVNWRLGQAAVARGDKEEARRRWIEIMPKLLEADPLKAEVRQALEAL